MIFLLGKTESIGKAKNTKQYRKKTTVEEKNRKCTKISGNIKTARKKWWLLSWSYLSAVTRNTCELQERIESATRTLRDICNFRKKKKFVQLKWLFSFAKKIGKKLKQAENTSKSTLLVCPAPKLWLTIAGYHQGMSETFYLTVPKN